MVDFDNPFARLAVACMVIGATLATAAIYLLPHLWAWLKPLLHAMTA